MHYINQIVARSPDFFLLCLCTKKSPCFEQGLKYQLQVLFHLVHYFFHQFNRTGHIR